MERGLIGNERAFFFLLPGEFHSARDVLPKIQLDRNNCPWRGRGRMRGSVFEDDLAYGEDIHHRNAIIHSDANGVRTGCSSAALSL
jgi:hypothetical protein